MGSFEILIATTVILSIVYIIWSPEAQAFFRRRFANASATGYNMPVSGYAMHIYRFILVTAAE